MADAMCGGCGETDPNKACVGCLQFASPPAREEAPAEGAAWSAIRNLFVTYAGPYAEATQYECASAIADKAARDIEDALRDRTSEPARDAWGWAVGGRAVPLVVTDTDKRDWWLASGATVQALFTHPATAPATADKLRDAMKSAHDLLAERKYGHAARSPGHNARLVLETALNEGGE